VVEFDELAGLKSNAEDVAGRLGHILTPGKDEIQWAHADCVRCKRRIAVALYPPPGTPQVCDSASTKGCL